MKLTPSQKDAIKNTKTPWMNIHEAARYCRISKETIYRRIYSKKMPFHRIGKVYLFNRLEMDAWIGSNGNIKRK
jgi:excisionase family DNA binding protein